MYLYLLNRMLWLGTISTFFIEVTLSSLPLDVKKPDQQATVLLDGLAPEVIY